MNDEISVNPDMPVNEMTFQEALENVINAYSMENGSNTPDFVLAKYLKSCLIAFDVASREREKWYGKELKA